MNMTPVSFMNVNLKKGFWFDKAEMNRDVTVFAVRDRFRDTGRFEAFKFNWKEGSSVPKPHIFWDSDVAKWMESVAYILAKSDIPELRSDMEELISLMEKNQQTDGYFNIAHTVVHPEKRFKIRDNHELYCLGHFIEAAVAWKASTGCDRLINIVDKYIDLVIRVFCEEKSAMFVTPGHEEIELALIKLYRFTKNRKYLDLAMFFIDERGKREEGLTDWYNSSYNQSHLPVRQQRQALGHAVRACYLYSAMADAAKETEDPELLDACKALFDDIVKKKMYITGGIGSSRHGEAFTVAYDLPSDTAYAETCASIALMMFADRMKDIELDSKYADIVEREIYNGIISGVSLDGKAFFYVNPLEINLSDRNRHTSMTNVSHNLPLTRRQEVFSCSCCPPNITRFFASIGDHIFSFSDDAVFVHQFIACDAVINNTRIEINTEYPSNGRVSFSVNNAKGKFLYVRIPGWCNDFETSAEYTCIGGYLKIDIDADCFEFSVDFKMKPLFYSGNSCIRAVAGKTAVMYGPVVYCAEGIDNSTPLSEFRLDINSAPEVFYDKNSGYEVITVKAYKEKSTENLYNPTGSLPENLTVLKMIPYYSFANRDECDMAVWFRK